MWQKTLTEELPRSFLSCAPSAFDASKSVPVGGPVSANGCPHALAFITDEAYELNSSMYGTPCAGPITVAGRALGINALDGSITAIARIHALDGSITAIALDSNGNLGHASDPAAHLEQKADATDFLLKIFA